jgi:hypothetical protein
VFARHDTTQAEQDWGRVVRYARAITFQLAEVAVTGAMVRAILAAIHRLRPPLSRA